MIFLYVREFLVIEFKKKIDPFFISTFLQISFILEKSPHYTHTHTHTHSRTHHTHLHTSNTYTYLDLISVELSICFSQLFKTFLRNIFSTKYIFEIFAIFENICWEIFLDRKDTVQYFKYYLTKLWYTFINISTLIRTL